MEENPSKKHGLAHFFAAAKYSLSGFRMLAGETAVRHELLLGVVHFAAVPFVQMPFAVKLVLSCLYAGVLIVEMLNTAIEAVVDLASPGFSPLAKKAKDIGSACVFAALTVFFASWLAALLRFCVF